MTSRRRTAIHEAGHAVAKVAFGIPIDYVSIRPGKHFGGICVGAPAEPTDTTGFDEVPVAMQPAALRADVERRVLVSLVGEIDALTLYRPTRRGPTRAEASEAEAISTGLWTPN